MIRVEQWPSLHEPVMVLGFEGWVDAGRAGADALGALVRPGAASFATLDLADVVDLQQTRPTVRLVDGGVRSIEWPRIEWVATRAGRDLIVVRGPEPSLRWPEIASEMVDVAARLGVTLAATLAGMPAMVSHRRPIPVLATAASRSLAQEVGPLRADYAGPTGFQTVVQHELGRAGIPCVGLWAQVPHYVSATPSPGAARSLLARVAEVAGLEIDLTPWDAPTDRWIAKIEEGLSERPDLARIVDQLDARADEAPSADELVSEIERFLRDES